MKIQFYETCCMTERTTRVAFCISMNLGSPDVSENPMLGSLVEKSKGETRTLAIV